MIQIGCDISMNIKHIYSGKSSYDGRVVTGQLIVVKEKMA